MGIPRRLQLLALVLVVVSFAPAPPPPEPPARPAEVLKLAQVRFQASLKGFEEAWVFYRQARVDAIDVFVWSKLVLESQAELSQTKEEYIAALEAHRGRMQELDRLVKKVRRVGFAPSLEVASADYFVKDAEYRLARAKAEPK